MAKTLENRTVAILATDGVEQVELTEPRKAVEEAGATVRLLSIKDGEIQGVHHDKPDDLPAFCRKIVEEFAQGRHQARG